MPSVKDLVRCYESKGLLSKIQRSPQKLKTSVRLPLQQTGNKLSSMSVKADGLANTVYRKMAELLGDNNVAHVPDKTTHGNTLAVDSSVICAVGGFLSDSFARRNSKESVDNLKTIQPRSIAYQATQNEGFSSYVNMACFKGGIKSRSVSFTSDQTDTEFSDGKRYDRTIYKSGMCSTQPGKVEYWYRGSNKNVAYLVGNKDICVERISEQNDTKDRQTNISTQGNESTKVRGEIQLSGELGERPIQIKKPKLSNCGSENGIDSLYGSETPVSPHSNKYSNTSFEREESYNRRTTLRQGEDCQHSSDVQIARTHIAPTRSSSGVTGSVFSLPGVGDTEGHNIGRYTDERQLLTTQRYVEEVRAQSQLPSRLKYPSEPTVRKLSESSRTRTQENIFNIHGSHVSILSSENGSGSASSLVSSEQERIRESITGYTKDSLLAHPKVLKHQCFMKAKRVLDDEGILFLVENSGSGATHLAWDLLSQDSSTEKYNILDVNDFLVCIRSKETKIMLADEAFGSSKLDENVLDRWLKHAAMCRKNKHTRMVKIIFTLKHHIASQCKQKLQAYHKNVVDLEDPKIQRDSDEMVELMKAMIKDNEEELKVILTGYNTTSKPLSSRKCYTYIPEKLLTEISEVALPSGFPKLCKQFLEARKNIKQGVTYFTRPTEQLLDDIVGMKTSKNLSDLDKCLTLVMTSVLGGRLTLDKVSSIDDNRHKCMTKPGKKKKKKKRTSKLKKENTEPTNEVPWWIQVINSYAKHSSTSLLETVKNGLHLLKGNFLKEDIKDVFCFAAPCVKNAVLILCGQDFPQYILKLCDQPFFQAYIGSDTSFEIGDKQCINIDVSDDVICGVANEMLLDIHANGDVETFAKHMLLSDRRFIQQFLVSFGKDHDQLWKLVTESDKMTGRCLVSCALKNEHVQSYYSITSNLAYSILLHPVWNQNRKKYQIWTAKKELEVLKHCCIRGHKDIYFELRKKHNIPVDYDCLRLAIESGTCAVVEEILHFIGTKMADEEKCKAMERALVKYTNNPLRSRHTVVDLLSKFVPIDYKVSSAEPFIHFATRSNDARMIVTLKVFEGDINVTNSDGKTCLLEAIRRNNGPFLKMALKHGADQRKPDSRRGFLPIHEATKQNNPYIMGLLVDADNDITMTTDSSGRHPLHIAALHNSFQAAQFLIDHGVEVDAYDDELNTPLLYAAASGHANVMHCLLEASADASKLDREGNSALLVACQTGNLKGVKRLLRYRCDMERDECQYECFFTAVEANQADILKLLVQNGFDINKTNQDGNTVLHIATERCYMKLVHYILKQSDNVLGVRNKKGEVPLHIAARNGNLVLVRTLLQHGSERSPISKLGSTPLHLVEDKLKQLEDAGSGSEYENYYCLILLLRKSGYRMSMETPV